MRLGRTLNLYHVQRDAFGPVRKKKIYGTLAQTSGFKTPKGKLTQLSANQLAPNPVSPPYPDQTLERQAGVVLTFCSAGSHSPPAEPLYLK